VEHKNAAAVTIARFLQAKKRRIASTYHSSEIRHASAYMARQADLLDHCRPLNRCKLEDGYQHM
jgi:hypothetical protein